MSDFEPDAPVQGEEAPAGPPTSRRHILGAAGFMMAAILLSRLLGLIRERVIAHQFGQGFNTDVYVGSFTIPDLLFFLIAGGALSGAFVPVFTEYISTNRRDEAWRIFSVVSVVMTVVVGVFIVGGEIWTHGLVLMTNPGFDLVAGKVEMTAALTRIVLPAQVCFFLGGLMMATQTCQGRFAGQAFGPVIYNLAIILGGLFLTARYGVAGLSYGAVAGAVVGNLVLQWILVRATGGYLVVRGFWRYFRHPGVIQVWKLMLPVVLGLALPQVSTIIGKIFASSLSNGSQTALMNANKLMQVPLGVFAQATAIAIFPTMAAQAARRETEKLRGSVNFGIRAILFLTLPASALMVVLALPIVQLVLQTGKFNLADSLLAAAVLRSFAIGIFAWSAHSILTRGFYALQDTRTPIVIGTVITVIFIPMNWPLRALFGVSGLALATSIAATIHMAAMLVYLRKRLHGLDGSRLLSSVTRMVIATAACMAAAWAARNFMGAHLARLKHHVTAAAALELAVCLFVATIVYLGSALAMRMDEVTVLTRIARRVSGAAG